MTAIKAWGTEKISKIHWGLSPKKGFTFSDLKFQFHKILNRWKWTIFSEIDPRSFRVFCPKLAEKWPLKWAPANSNFAFYHPHLGLGQYQSIQLNALKYNNIWYRRKGKPSLLWMNFVCAVQRLLGCWHLTGWWEGRVQARRLRPSWLRHSRARPKQGSFFFPNSKLYCI